MRCSRSLSSRSFRRRMLAIQIASLMGLAGGASGANHQSPTADNLVFQSVLTPEDSVSEPPTSPNATATPGSGDGFLGDNVGDDAVAPSLQADIDATVEQSNNPAIGALPANQGLDAPSFALSTGLGASLGATRESYSQAPAMIGDFFGGSFLFESVAGQTISLAGGDRRFKISENVSPMPQDRVYVNYNHFENALNDYLGRPISLDRVAIGMEKTFLDGIASIDTRLPIAHGLNSTQDYASTNTDGTELGNLSFALKAILLSGSRGVLSFGTTLTLPTGDDYVENFAGSSPFLVVENDAVHMAPFVGWLVRPNDQWFAQGFVQTDFDLNGNDVRTAFSGFEGVLQDQNLLFVDASVGKWLLKSKQRNARLSGLAAISELHYTMTMNDSDRVAGIGNPFENVDVLNMTNALHFQLQKTALRIGAGVPLRNDEERLFDAEIIAQMTRAF